MIPDITAIELRQRIYKFATGTPEGRQFSTKIFPHVNATNQSFTEYAKRMKTDREWTWLFELAIISQKYAMNIVVITQVINPYITNIRKWLSQVIPEQVQ